MSAVLKPGTASTNENPASGEAGVNAEETTDGFHLVIDALKLNGIDTDLRPARHSDHRPDAHGAGRGPARHLVPPRAARRQRRRHRRLPDAEARHLPDRVGAGLPQRPDRARQRDHQLLPDDPHQRLERARDRRPAAGRLRRDGPARDRQAAVQGRLPRAARRRHRHRHRARHPRRGLGPARAACTSTCRPSCSRRRSTRRPAGAR